MRNIPVLDQSIKVLKIGGPIATPKNLTEPYNDVTNPLRSEGTDPVIKLLIQGRIRPVPILLITRTEIKGINFSKKMSVENEIVIRIRPIIINDFINFIFFPILLPVI